MANLASCRWCGKGGHLVDDCPDRKPMKKVIVEKVALQPEKVASQVASRNKSKQEKWRERNKERYREYRREYMRKKRRGDEVVNSGGVVAGGVSK